MAKYLRYDFSRKSVQEKRSTGDEILRYLAESPEPKNKWEIKKDLVKSYGNVHENIQIMLKAGLIQVKKIRKSSKNPKIKMECYDLGLRGLIIVLCLEFDKVDMLAEKYSYLLPSIFGEWDFFKKKNVLPEVHEKLHDILARFFENVTLLGVLDLYDGPSQQTPDDLIEKDILKKFVFPDAFRFYVVYPNPGQLQLLKEEEREQTQLLTKKEQKAYDALMNEKLEKMKRWYLLIRENPRLCQYLLKWIDDIETHAKDNLARLGSLHRLVAEGHE